MDETGRVDVVVGREHPPIPRLVADVFLAVIAVALGLAIMLGAAFLATSLVLHFLQ
jgi:hypothetical protein